MDAPAAKGPFDRLAWFQGLVRHGGIMPLLAVACGNEGLAILPLAQAEEGLSALVNWYAFTVRPIFSPNSDAPLLLTAIARDLGKRHARITLHPVPDEAGEAQGLVRAFRKAGWFVTREISDTNHYLPVAGRSYAQYLATRPGPLRTTLKRKAKKVAITIHDRFNEAAWTDYETVYGQSWKPGEGSPDCLKHFACEEGRAGRLRLAIAHADIDGLYQPVAAQMWTVENGTAYIHKLAYIEAAKSLSPGTSLSAALFERVIDTDKVDFVDFGTGDDPYKRDWMEAERPRYKITMMRPTAPAQWPAMAKAIAKRLVRHFRHS